MPVRIEFYRPRGINGNYKVKITLDLLPTEYAVVGYDYPNVINPTLYFTNPKGWVEGERDIHLKKDAKGLYQCEFIITKDATLSIGIYDEDVIDIHQIQNYVATETTIEAMADQIPTITLEPIDLIDKGNSP